MRGIIYKWTNKINNKCYIGKTIREKERIQQHLKDRRCNSTFHKALDKYGVNNFSYEVLFETHCQDDKEMNTILNEMEKFYIKEYNSNYTQYGYNLTSGGDGISGRYGEQNPFYNHHHTDEWKQQHSEALKGKKPNKETIIKRSNSLKLVKHTKEWNEKVGLANRKAVVAYKDGIKIGSYNSYNECKENLKLPNIKGISKVINGHNKTYYGYTFTKIEDNVINNKDNETSKD